MNVLSAAEQFNLSHVEVKASNSLALIVSPRVARYAANHANLCSPCEVGCDSRDITIHDAVNVLYFFSNYSVIGLPFAVNRQRECRERFTTIHIV